MWSYHSQLKEFAKSLVRQFVIGPTSTAIGLVEFSTDARVLSVGGVNGLSFDADALMQVIDSMASPNGWTHINAGLEMGLQVMLGTNGTEPNSRPNVRRRIMVLLTDGEQNSQFGGTKKAIETAKATTAAGDFILKSVGFGGILESTLNDMASEPISENAYLGNNLQAVMEHFSGFCSQLSSPRPPPPPSPLPASPPPPSPWMPPPPPPPRLDRRRMCRPSATRHACTPATASATMAVSGCNTASATCALSPLPHPPHPHACP